MNDVEKKPESPPPSRAKRWRRRLIVALAVFAVVAIALRVAVNVLLPSVLRKVAAGYDLNCDFERSQMNLASGDAELWYLKFTPKTGGEPVLKLDYVRGNISTLALLRGKLDVWRMEADGVDLLVERQADGKVPLLERFLKGPAQPAPAPVANSSDPRKIDLSAPLKIDAFRLSHVKARIVDRTISPANDSMLTLNVRVSDVQSNVRPTSFAIDVWNDPALDLLRIEGQGKARGKTVDADINLLMRGLHPKALAAYLEPMGLRPVAINVGAAAQGKLKLGPAPAPAEALTGSLVLEKCWVGADGELAAGFDRLELDIDSADFSAARFGKLLIDGVRLAAERSEQGSMAFCGFELVAPTPSAATKVAQTAAPPSFNYRWSIADASVRKVQASFADASVKPAADLAFEVDSLSATNISSDLQNASPIELSGNMRAPGLVQSIALTGEVQPTTDKSAITLSVKAGGINPEALKPYLDVLGLQSELRSGEFTAELTGELTRGPDGRPLVQGSVTRLRLTDGTDLLALDDIKVGAVGVDPASGLVRVESIDIAGPSIFAKRDAAGEISLFGLRTKPAIAAAAPATAPHPSETTTLSLPKLAVGRFTWKDFKFHLDDQSTSPPTTVTLADAGVEITNLLIDANAEATVQPGKIRAWAAAPGVVERIQIDGTLSPKPKSLAAELQIAATGLTASAIKPYLAAAGVEPNLKSGELNLAARFEVSQLDQGLGVGLKIDKLRYTDAETELLALDALNIEGLELRPGEVVVGAVKIDGPRARADRDGQGIISAAGFKFIGTPPTTAPTTAPSSPPELPVASIKSLRVNDATLTWTDAAAPKPVAATAHATVALDNLTLGRESAPASFEIAASVDGTLDRSLVSGTLSLARQRQDLNVQVKADGMRAAVLSAYLPPGMELSLRDGHFSATIEATASANPEGGDSKKLVIRDVSLSDGVAPPLFKLDQLVASAPRVDPAGGRIEIDEITLAGLEAVAHIAPEGTTRLPGLTLKPAPPPTVPEGEAPTTQPASGGGDFQTLVAEARRPLPLLTVEKLDLNIARFTLHNDTVADSAPLVAQSLRVRNLNRIEMGGPDAAARPPARIEVTSTLDPIVDQLKLTAELAPLAQQPSANIDLELSGIRGEGLTKLIPELAQQLDGTGMTDGRFKSRVELTGKFARRGQGLYDLTKPFDLALLITGTEFRAEPEGHVLAGAESVRAEAVHVEPQTGAISVKALEVNTPKGRVWRDQAGVHVLGWTLRPTSQPTTAPTAQIASYQPATAPAIAATPAEMKVGKLTVSGLDFTIEDKVLDPPLLVPLNGLDLEVRDLSNLLVYEPGRAVRFNALVTSGKVTLPALKAGAGQTEEREVVSQVAASGRVSLHPHLDGWAKASVSGFDLASLQGAVHAQDITLNKGVFDTRVDVRFKDGGNIDAQTRSVITDLELAEPPNGPIQRNLKLPGTLDMVITALEDLDGSITVPMNVPIREGELSGGAIAGAAVGAFFPVVGTAMASAALKPVSGILPQAEKGGASTVELQYPAGVTSLSPEQIKALNEIVARMKKDENVQVTLRHELSAGDVARAHARANPTDDECRELAYRLRARKIDLLEQRAQVAGQTRASIAATAFQQGEQLVARLREIDREIAQTEDSLDQTYELLKPGANLQSERRTRAAALDLARSRLDAAKAYLLAGGVKKAADRIQAAGPTYAPFDSTAGGRVIVTVIAKKRQ